MEDSEKSEALPQLLDLIPNGREWKTRGAQVQGRTNTGFGTEDDEKLELKLGLPGLVQEESGAVSRDEGLQQESPTLYLGYLIESSKAATSTTTTGTKRGFLDTVETKIEGRNEQKQQPIVGCGNEVALEEKIAAASERKKGFCSPLPSHTHTTPSVRNSSGNRSQAQGRGNSTPVVGWPPIRSFRRNLANGSSSRQLPEPPNGETSTKEKLTCKKKPLVKINMDGIPIGRKVDLTSYDSYESLSAAVKELFHGFLEAQKDISSAESAQSGAEEKMFSQLLDGSGEYTLVYEDNEGDRMLVGDVPWNVFVATAQRLRVLRSSELSCGLIGVATRKVTNC